MKSVYNKIVRVQPVNNLNLENLLNVEANTATNGQTIVFNNGKWVNANQSGAVSSVFGRTGAVTANEGDYTIGQMGDVKITSPAAGQYLRYQTGVDIGFANSNILLNDLPTITNAKLQNSTIGLTCSQGTFSSSPVALGGTTNLTIQDASNSVAGIINTGAQTLAGNKIFNNSIRVNGGILDNTGGAGSAFQYLSNSGLWTTLPDKNIVFNNNSPITAVLDTIYVLTNTTITLPGSNSGDIGKKIIISTSQGSQTTITVPPGVSLSNYGSNFSMNNPRGAISLIVSAANQYEIIGMQGTWFSASLPKPVTASNLNVSQLQDTTITSPSTGQILGFNGTNWINQNNTRIYNSGGLISSPKIWVGTGLTISNGSFNIDISSAGFTTVYSVQATAVLSGSSANNAPNATLRTISTTAVTGLVTQSAAVFLGGQGLTNAPANISVQINVIGI